jgi:LEM3 (ligand-effect modulator 3) family / CDC50 family
MKRTSAGTPNPPRKTKIISLRKMAFIKWNNTMKAKNYMKMHMIVALLSLTGLLPLIYQSFNLQSFWWRYDDQCAGQKTCFFTVNILQEVPANSIGFIYLKGFTQANRKFLNSVSEQQLKGSVVSDQVLNQTCSPAFTNRDLGVTNSYTGVPLNPDAPAYPCGLFPKYFPFDDLRIFDSSNNEVILNKTSDLTWPGLKGNKFRNTNTTTQWIDIESDRFVNWMRPNTYPSTYKGWFRPTSSIAAGAYTFQVNNALDVSLFAGEKYFGFEEYSVIGAKNYILLFSMILVFIISTSLSVFFWVLIARESELEKKLGGRDTVKTVQVPLLA